MSFAATVEAVRARQKTVTRRLGWKYLKPGDRLLACAKTRGVRVEDRDELAVIEVVRVSRESLSTLTRVADGEHAIWAYREVFKEGFTGMTVHEFVDMFCELNKCDPSVEVTRIEFQYITPPEES